MTRRQQGPGGGSGALEAVGVAEQILQSGTPTHRITDRRRQVVVAMVRDKLADPAWLALSPEAQLMYVVGGLVCDEAGFIAEAVLMRACANPRVLMVADALLCEAREVGS